MIRTVTNAREMVVFAASRVIRQGRSSERPAPPNHSIRNAICAYRGRKGARCPVGWLIPDDIAKTCDRHVVPADEFSQEDIALFYRGPDDYRVVRNALVMLQDAHDEAANDKNLGFVDAFLFRLEIAFGSKLVREAAKAARS